MARDIEAVEAELAKFKADVVRNWARGLDHDEYMQQVGRWRLINDLEQRLQELKRRRGDDDDNNPGDGGAGRRRGIGADSVDSGNENPPF